MLGPHPLHLRRRGADPAEHPPVPRDKTETVRIRQPRQFRGQRLAQAQHVQPHLLQLGLPLRPQARIRQDRRHDPRPVVGRKGIVLPVKKGEVALRHPRLCRVPPDGDQKPRPLAIDAEVLGTGRRDDAFVEPRRHRPRGPGIGIKPVAEPLIGDVDKRHRPPRLQKRDDRLPLLLRQVRPGRVVAAAMQQHRIPRHDLPQIGHQPGKVDIPRALVEIAVLGHLHAKVSHDRGMVRPGRRRKPDRRPRRGQPDQLQRLPDRPRAARRGHRRHPFPRHRAAQHQPNHRLGKGGIAGQPGIGLGLLRLPDAPLRRLHCPHHRRQPRRVLVDAHAQVDLVLARIVPIGRHQRQDLVRRLLPQMLEHHPFPFAMGRSSKPPHSVHDPS